MLWRLNQYWARRIWRTARNESHDLSPPASRAALTVTGIDDSRHHNSCDQRRHITRHSKRHGDDIVTKGYTEILQRGQGYLSPPLSILIAGKNQAALGMLDLAQGLGWAGTLPLLPNRGRHLTRFWRP
jgi:hypothetical protein